LSFDVKCNSSIDRGHLKKMASGIWPWNTLSTLTVRFKRFSLMLLKTVSNLEKPCHPRSVSHLGGHTIQEILCDFSVLKEFVVLGGSHAQFSCFPLYMAVENLGCRQDPGDLTLPLTLVR
jgi:hypothetical protein